MKRRMHVSNGKDNFLDTLVKERFCNSNRVKEPMHIKRWKFKISQAVRLISTLNHTDIMSLLTEV
jgi:hypothetical protein